MHSNGGVCDELKWFSLCSTVAVEIVPMVRTTSDIKYDQSSTRGLAISMAMTVTDQK